MSRSPIQAVGSGSTENYLESFRALERMILEGGSFSGRERNCVFLNLGEGQFGNISAVSGLDFPDDARAVATADWDHDGDLDVWVVNRSAPQLRFLRNDTPAGAHFLRVRLMSRVGNRDGIGARLELHLKDQSARRMIRTLRAGEGYLSQSSKWVHFGLGSSREIDRLVIQWPGGKTEAFTGLKPDRRYLLHQGTGKAELWEPPQRKVTLLPKRLDAPPEEGQARAWLGSRPPVRPWVYRDFQELEKSLQDFRGQPVLVNLWATWCPPCIKELGQWARQEQTLREQGLQILALSVDGLEDDRPANPAVAREFLARLNFPFASGRATRALLARLEVLRNALFQWARPFAVPTSFLIDDRGQLAAIYTGPVEVERLLADLALIHVNPEQSYIQGLPFQGLWLTQPSPIEPGSWATKLAQAHYNLAIDLARAGRPDEAAVQYRETLQLNPDQADAHNNLAAILTDQGMIQEAIDEYREAIRIDPEHKHAHNNLGVLLLNQPGRLDEAIEHFKRVLTIDPEAARSHVSLGLALARQGKIADGEKHFREAVQIEPEYDDAHFHLGAALHHQGKVKEALSHYRKALAANPGSADAHFRIGAILAGKGQAEAAIRHAREALQINPDHIEALHALAWTLATGEEVQRQEAEEAVRLALRACELTNQQHPLMLDTLAIAYAAAGRFEEAIASAEQALQLLQAGGQAGAAAQIRQRLELYRAGTRYRH